MMKHLFMPILALLFVGVIGCSETVDDNTTKPTTIVESFERAMSDDATYSYGYANDNLTFQHTYDQTYGNWYGFAQSRCYDMESGAYENQYSVYNEAPASGDCFLLYYYDTYNSVDMNTPMDILSNGEGVAFRSIGVCLPTYVYKTVTEGNPYARAFVDGDYLKLSFIGLDDNLRECGVVEYYAVDLRDGKQHFTTSWTEVDLLSLGSELQGLRIRIETTDVGDWGPNTPLYICIDDLTYDI